MLEIEILKFIILDQNLLEIMNFISKPSVSFKNKNEKIEEEIKKFFFSDLNKHSNFSMDKIKESYGKIMSEDYSKNTYVKDRILKLFRSQIEEMI